MGRVKSSIPFGSLWLRPSTNQKGEAPVDMNPESCEASLSVIVLFKKSFSWRLLLVMFAFLVAKGNLLIELWLIV